MKPKIDWLAALLTSGSLGMSALGEDPKPPASTNQVSSATAPAKAVPASTVVPVVASAEVTEVPRPIPRVPVLPVPSISQPPVAADEQVVAEVPLVLAVATSPIATPGEDTQRRLEPPTPEELMAKYGTIGFLLRQPEPRNFLEMINPFAPDEFGGQRREVYNRNPNLKPGATLPRSFIGDSIRNEPEVHLISWPW